MSQYHIKNDILISPILSCEANVYKIWWIYLGGKKKKYEYNNFFWVFGTYQKKKFLWVFGPGFNLVLEVRLD